MWIFYILNAIIHNMTIFIVVSQPNPNQAKLPASIASVFPNDHLQISDKVWLVASSDSIQDVSKKLGVADGACGAAVITEVGSYFGRASPNIWSWIKSKWESTANG